MVTERTRRAVILARDARGRIISGKGRDPGTGSTIDDSGSEDTGNVGNETINPVEALGGQDGGQDGGQERNGRFGKRGRYKPRKGTAGGQDAQSPRAPSNSSNVGTIQASLTEIHEFLAAIAHEPAFALTDAESKRLAGALVTVGKHYRVPVINPKYVALATLAGVSYSIYKPRVMLLAKPKAAPVAVKPAAPAPVPASATLPDNNMPRVDEWFTAPGGNA